MAPLESYAEQVPALMSLGALAIVSVEWLALGIAHKLERHKEGLVNIISGILTFIPVFALSKVFTLAAMFWLHAHAPLRLGLDWWVWVLAYIAFDFSSWVVHKLSHDVRLLWCVHSVHHSAQEMKTSVSFRGSFADVFVTPHTTLWLPLLGFHPLMIVIIEGVAMMWGVLLHLNDQVIAKQRWPWLEPWLIVPSAHRLHHRRNHIYLDTNFGLTLSIWDHLFSTYQRSVPGVAVEYGTLEDIDGADLLVVQTDAFRALWRDLRAAPRLRDKLRYLLYPPGWNHLDGGHSARQLRALALASKPEA